MLVIFTPKHAILEAASPITTTFTRLFFSDFGIYKESFTNHFVCMYICREIHNNYYSASQGKATTYIIKGLRATISIISSNVFSLKVRLEVCTQIYRRDLKLIIEIEMPRRFFSCDLLMIYQKNYLIINNRKMFLLLRWRSNMRVRIY